MKVAPFSSGVPGIRHDLLQRVEVGHLLKVSPFTSGAPGT